MGRLHKAVVIMFIDHRTATTYEGASLWHMIKRL